MQAQDQTIVIDLQDLASPIHLTRWRQDAISPEARVEYVKRAVELLTATPAECVAVIKRVGDVYAAVDNRINLYLGKVTFGE